MPPHPFMLNFKQQRGSLGFETKDNQFMLKASAVLLRFPVEPGHVPPSGAQRLCNNRGDGQLISNVTMLLISRAMSWGIGI